MARSLNLDYQFVVEGTQKSAFLVDSVKPQDLYASTPQQFINLQKVMSWRKFGTLDSANSTLLPNYSFTWFRNFTNDNAGIFLMPERHMLHSVRKTAAVPQSRGSHFGHFENLGAIFEPFWTFWKF